MLGRLSWISLALFSLAFGLPSDDIYDQKGYYMFPIRPGEINYLSGSMGELRSTHFHFGIDIKTGGVEGYTVYSAADGFLNRVKVSRGGYGKTLYIQHPNNTFTVYAHLKNFSKEVADYVRAQQYRKKSYEVDLFPQKGQFSFFKGDIIAASGNTGSSSAPHLHFEIRDENHRLLDPLRFGFPEIIDSKVPEIRSVAIKTFDIESRVNGKFGRYDFEVRREGSKFYIDEPVELEGKVGLELYAFDRQNDTRNRYGLPCVEFYHNEELVYSHHIKTFSFGEVRNLLVHTNYSHMVETRRRYHKLYVDDGNEMRIYGTNERGILDINDTLPHDFTVKLWDVEGNSSELHFTANRSAVFKTKSPRRHTNGYRVSDNVLQLERKYDEEGPKALTVYANRFQYELTPAYEDKGKSYYLWDLRDGLPDSVDYCGSTEQLNFKTMIPSNSEFSYFGESVELDIGRRALFDTLYLQTWVEMDTVNQREIFHFDHTRVPFRKYIEVTLKPQREFPDQERTGIYTVSGKGKLGFVGGAWKDGKVSIYTRDLANYTIAVDSIPPTIKPVKVNADGMSFIIDDEMSGIRSYEALVNGEWVLMNYEDKKKFIWSEKLDPNIPFSGELLLTVEDNAGNKSTYRNRL